jgi:hypothetical protein
MERALLGDAVAHHAQLRQQDYLLVPAEHRSGFLGQAFR